MRFIDGHRLIKMTQNVSEFTECATVKFSLIMLR